MDVLAAAVVVGSAATVIGASGAYVVALRRRYRRNQARLAAAREQQLHIPPTLHPIIDPRICMGSAACVAACPEGEIIGIINGKAELIDGSRCIGHTRCEAACPTGAIRLVFGTQERPIDLPETDGYFETSRPGVHVVGELGGMGLIKNAFTQGREVAQYLKERAGKANAGGCDVAIVGAGPAGLATALGCHTLGLRYEILEQATLGGAIAHYPRHKVVMTETVELPGVGRFGRKTMQKEDLLASLQQALRANQVEVHENTRVTAIDGADGNFSVTTTRGKLNARKVVLAMGRQGTPRRLEVPGEDLPKVAYRLIDPEQYEGKKVLVVGGGDSAVEAACMLAEESSAEVSISYRSPVFGRCKPANRDKIAAFTTARRIHAVMQTEVAQIEEKRVVLRQGERSFALANDFVLVCAGGILPLEFLEAAHIAVRRHRGEDAHRPAGGPQALAPGHRPATKPAPGSVRGGWLGKALFVLGLAVVVFLAWKGGRYYLLPGHARADLPQHAWLKPAGLWGHGIGVVATAVMLCNFLYAVRKRIGFLGGLGSLRTWMTFHVFVGIMSPIVIAFHAAFQSNNILATATAGSLAVVVGTGLIGRYMFGLLPKSGDHIMGIDDLKEHWAALLSQIDESESHVTDVRALARLRNETARLPQVGSSLLVAAVRLPIDYFTSRLHVHSLRRLFPHRADYHLFRAAYLVLRRTRMQIAFYDSLRGFMSIWRVFHVVLSLFLVLIMTGHIGLSLYLGYGWILF